MTPILALIQPWDIVAAARVDVRVGSALEAEAYGLNATPWLPAMIERPQLSIEIMAIDLSGGVQVGKARIVIGIDAAGIPDTKNYKWGGAPIKIYSASKLAWPAVTEFDGEITEASLDLDARALTLSASVSTSLIEKPLLTLEFDGSGGAGGDAEKRGTLKPAGFGACENIQPVWFNATLNIGMIDGYANTTAITKLMEGASDMGARVADYANYAALAAAITAHTIPPGRWGSCVAEGLVGLGAPPVGIIGVNATFGSNRLGAMMSRILQTHAGVAGGQIDAASFTALDTALNYPTHFWTESQVDVKQLLETMARSGNASLLMTFQRKVAVSRAVASASVATLDRSGKQTPRCVDWKSLPAPKPVWKLKARAARPANVLTFDQVNYVDTIIDRGAYSAATVYRAGNLVWLADKSSWLYTNATADLGHAPPTWPTTSNSYWQNLTAPTLATINNVTYSASAPSTPVDGDIWIDTSVTPVITRAMVSGAWRSASNLVTKGSDIDVDDGATASDNLIRNGGLTNGVVDWLNNTPTHATRVAAGATDPVPAYWNFDASSIDVRANNGDFIPVIGGSNLYISASIYSTNFSTSTPQLNVWQYDATGGLISAPAANIASSVSSAWETKKDIVVLAANCAKITINLSSIVGASQSIRVGNMRIAFTEKSADVTALAQVIATLTPTDQSIAADYTGTITGVLADVLWGAVVTKGGVGVSKADLTTYALSGASGGTFAADNTNGSSGKGNVTISAMSANTATVDLAVSYDGSQVAKFTLRLDKVLGAPPTTGGTPGKTVTWTTGDFVGLNTTSYTLVASPLKTVALASGESLYGTAALDYIVSGQGAVTRTMSFKWQYSVAGAGSWNDFPSSPVTGSTATSASNSGAPEYELDPAQPGSAAVTLTKGGLSAGNYDVRLVAICSATGRTCTPSGTASVEAKV